MKFRSTETLGEWLTQGLTERVRKNAEDMIADGCTQDEVNAVKAMADVERCRNEALATVRRILSDPDVPSHELQ